MINFKQYDQDNPLIWDLFVFHAHKAKHKGEKRISAKAIFEDIRRKKISRNGDKFSLNNSMHPDYATKMMDLYPEFRGMFEQRVRKTLRVL